MAEMHWATVSPGDHPLPAPLGKWRGLSNFRSAASTGFATLVSAIVVPLRRPSTREHSHAAVDDTEIRFDRVIIPHLDAAYNFARFLCRDADAAQDIVQEAFLRSYRNFEGYRGGDPRSWIFAIVRNCYHAWLQESRRRTRFETSMTDGRRDDADGSQHAAYEVASEEDTPESALIRTTESQQVRALINSLPDALREVLVLRELEQLSYRQIADVIDLPIGTVMSRLARARQEFGKGWGVRRMNEDKAS